MTVGMWVGRVTSAFAMPRRDKPCRAVVRIRTGGGKGLARPTFGKVGRVNPCAPGLRCATRRRAADCPPCQPPPILQIDMRKYYEKHQTFIHHSCRAFGVLLAVLAPLKGQSDVTPLRAGWSDRGTSGRRRACLARPTMTTACGP